MTTDRFVATDVIVRYNEGSGRLIFEFENPEGVQIVSFPPYRMERFLDQVFEEGDWEENAYWQSDDPTDFD